VSASEWTCLFPTTTDLTLTPDRANGYACTLTGQNLDLSMFMFGNHVMTGMCRLVDNQP
jgi:hypothetical protein